MISDKKVSIMGFEVGKNFMSGQNEESQSEHIFESIVLLGTLLRVSSVVLGFLTKTWEMSHFVDLCFLNEKVALRGESKDEHFCRIFGAKSVTCLYLDTPIPNPP